jgi:hypothetical protein
MHMPSSRLTPPSLLQSAPPPFKTNSYAATLGTARKIKAHNSSVKVLMYWNSALHFNFYECESEVQPSWIKPNPSKSKQPFYDYTVPAFREWWVRCAADSVTRSGGMIDGLFLDATPKLEGQGEVGEWAIMVDKLRAELPPTSIVINNGYFMSPVGGKDAGDDAWAHTETTYIERMSSIGSSLMTPAIGVEYLRWLANGSAAHPDRLFYGHGDIDTSDPLNKVFYFGLAKYLLIASSVERGFFLANTDYSIDGGLLKQPKSVYTGSGVGCGEPTAPFERIGEPYVLRRTFNYGYVEVDVGAATALINCSLSAVVRGSN